VKALGKINDPNKVNSLEVTTSLKFSNIKESLFLLFHLRCPQGCNLSVIATEELLALD